MVVAGRAAVGLVAVAVLVATGMGWRQYHHELNGLTIAGVSPEGPKSSGKTQNILIMGLDSRLDEHGNALPQDMYDALHAGDDSEGGFNANVLILVHIPGMGRSRPLSRFPGMTM